MTFCTMCGRESFLWSGNSCDICDRDSDGIADVNESIGFSPIPQPPSLFVVPEKGWEIHSMHYATVLGRIPLRVLSRMRAKIAEGSWHGMVMAGSRRVIASETWEDAKGFAILCGSLYRFNVNQMRKRLIAGVAA